MNKLIGLINYKISNIRSVRNAFEKINLQTKIINENSDFDECTHLVLPGVGTYKKGMLNLERLNLIEPILKDVKKGKPILGLCLGMQLFSEIGEEFGPSNGLNLIPGNVSRIKCKKLILPHVGWNEIIIEKKNSHLFKGIPNKSCFYFIHSFAYSDIQKSNISSKTHYEIDFVSAIESENIFGAQFHPEKSQKYGLKLLKNFSDIN